MSSFGRPILPLAIGTRGGSSDSNSSKYLIPLLVISWYSLACVSVCSSKVITESFNFPLQLCLIQLLSAAWICYGTLKIIEPNQNKSLIRRVRVEVILAGLLFCFGFVFTNYAFSCSTVSFAETIKAGEPISTLLLGLFFYSERATNLTYATIVPICFGVGLSCYSSNEFIINCFVFASLSNFCFSGRAVIVKRLNVHGSTVVDEITLFGQMCLVGCAVVAPLWIFQESSKAVSHFFKCPVSEILNLIFLFLLNGCAFTAYNLLSMLVLAKTQLFTHTILNAIRRVFIITSSVIFFGNYISPLNKFGVGISVLGGCFYSYVKSFK